MAIRATNRLVRSVGLWLALIALVVAGGAPSASAQEMHLPVPRATLYPGDLISEEQLSDRAFIAHTVARSTVFEGREGLVGKVARRTLLPGQPIALNAIRDPYVVNQGKSAVVVFEAGGLTITSHATALQNAGIGEVVSLRNNDSGNTIKGVVAADGTVRVSP
jgi:flagella basal body P-ring formation protein FlgA